MRLLAITNTCPSDMLEYVHAIRSQAMKQQSSASDPGQQAGLLIAQTAICSLRAGRTQTFSPLDARGEAVFAPSVFGGYEPALLLAW